MDDEARQLLREIRDSIRENAEQYRKTASEMIAAEARWRDELRARMNRADTGRRIIAGIVCVGALLILAVYLIAKTGPTPKEKYDEVFPGVRVKREAP